MKRQIILESRLFFKDQIKESFEDCLKGISKSTLLKISQTFIAYRDVNVIDFIGTFISSENLDLAQQGLDILSIRRGNNYKIKDYYILTSTVSLIFYERIIDLETPETDEITPKDIEYGVLKAYLLLNDIEAQKDEQILSTLSYNVQMKPSWLMLIAMLRYHAVINVSLLKEFYVQLVKAHAFLIFLQTHQPELLQELLREFSCNRIEEFLIRFVNFVLPAIDSIAKKQKTEITVPKIADYEEVIHFADALSHVTINEDIDFKSLRSVPMHKINDNVYIPIMPLFLIEQIYKGLYFRLSRINRKLKIVPDLKSYIGKEFTENVLFYNVIRNVFKNRYFQRSGIEMDLLADGRGNPDYYIRNGNKVYIFELKDVLLNSNVLTSQDYSKIEPELREKFYKNSKGHHKRVTQLAHNCKDILSGTIKWDTAYKPRRVKIWPIIVVTDNIFSIPGFNQILNNWFQEYLNTEISGINQDQVQPLTVITLDTLLYFPKNEVPNIDRLLSGYSTYLNPQLFIGSKPLTEYETTVKYQESMNPFDLVLAKRAIIDWKKLISEKISTLNLDRL
ncbi:MAG: hypothetical protein HDS89_08690 [Bacteroidales bacterium]|nr:hypothetical protein [Bacteroidales bacterium]